MRYLVTARVKPGRKGALLRSIREKTLGAGSIAGDEYLRAMAQSRMVENKEVRWLEVCYCETPLQEERPYWQEYFELLEIKDAHDRSRCRDLNGEEPWACSGCDCTRRLEQKMQCWGRPFLNTFDR